MNPFNLWTKLLTEAEFHAATRSEQLVAETCKRLLMNAIVCWNYLHLSQHLARLPPE
ncbi:hypothetical protein E4631_19955 [Hymenobacter sp. UV11]|uniref:Tn3 family transposase n=1 Tax=Hymenobacter sp. UV11 TaxID=1849735 RepID=UPI00105C9796|nr:Tn3 family transposase [Hymenobacter sp. UV11]TFZ64276.1 hypothetical protein E4631_19955 [Hymenobacter sp. UV11]